MENKETDFLSPKGSGQLKVIMENKLYTPEEVQKLLDDQKRICGKRAFQWFNDISAQGISNYIKLADYPDEFKTDKENK